MADAIICPVCGQAVHQPYLAPLRADGRLDPRYVQTRPSERVHETARTRAHSGTIVCFAHVFRFTPRRLLAVINGPKTFLEKLS